MYKLPDLENKQIMFDAGITWHLTVPTERMGRFIAHYEVMKKIKNIPGDIVECGVFKGESLMRFAHFRNILGTNDSAQIIAFDNFSDVYPDTNYEEDQLQRQHWMETAGSSSIKVEQLSQVFNKHKFSNYQFISGNITKTVPEFVKNNKGFRISLLHIDCDFTEPTYTSLKYLYPLVCKGGIILLDNYSGRGTSGLSYFGDTKGVEDFMDELHNKPMLHKFDWISRPCYIIKD